MDLTPFNSWIIVDRLKVLTPDVGLAADLAAVRNLRDFRTPSIYAVFSEEQQLGDNRNPSPGCSVSVNGDFAVVLALRNYASYQIGGQLRDESSGWVGKVRNCLHAWRPEKGCSRVAWQRGGVYQYDESVMLWADYFSLSYMLTHDEIDCK